MKRIPLFLAAAFFASSCSTTTQNLEKASSTKTATHEYAENYQEIYRRVADTAKRCTEGYIAFSLAASNSVDSELYSELGYGEVSLSLINVGVRNYYWKAKIERAGESASSVTIYSGSTLNNKMWLRKVKTWADGSGGC